MKFVALSLYIYIIFWNAKKAYFVSFVIVTMTFDGTTFLPFRFSTFTSLEFFLLDGNVHQENVFEEKNKELKMLSAKWNPLCVLYCRSVVLKGPKSDFNMNLNALFSWLNSFKTFANTFNIQRLYRSPFKNTFHNF